MADSSQGAVQPGQKRSRLGCLSCRRRRRKCDGAQPRCQNCQARGDECRWGLRASFHPSRTLRLSSEDSAALLAIEGERGRPGGLFVTTIVDNTDQIVREYQDLHPPASGDPQSSGEVATQPDGHLDPSISGYHLEAHVAEYTNLDLTPPRSVELDHRVRYNAADSAVTVHGHGPAVNSRSLQTTSPSLAWNHHLDQNNASSATPLPSTFLLDGAASLTAPSETEAELPVSAAEQTQLIRAYLKETGQWCETTDSERHFTVSYVHKLMENKPFVAAAITLASKQLDALRHSERQSTLMLYQHTVQSLIHYELSQCGEATLATCTLLSVFEMMASDVSEWRRHLKGCVWNLKFKGWNGSSPGLVNACFWAFARIDVWSAFVLEQETLIPTKDWVEDNNVHSIVATGSIDTYCNFATLIFAKIINFIATSRKQQDPLPDGASKIKALWDELQGWRIHRPRQVLPLVRKEADQRSPFPTVLYASSSSICGNTFYHAGSILLLRMGYVYQKETDAETHIYDQIWHARELCGISTANESHANWVNQLQPLYIAGKVFGDGSTRQQGASPRVDEDDIANKEEYAVEKLALLKHLLKIEHETGWATAGRAAELRRLWGLE